MKFARVTTIAFWVILAISFFLIISLITHINPNESNPGMLKWLGANLYWSYILLVIAIGVVLVLEFLNILADKKAAKNTLTKIGMLGAVILVSYMLSDTKMPEFHGAEKFIENGTATPTKLLWIGTGLIASYILFVIAVITILWSAIAGFFK